MDNKLNELIGVAVHDIKNPIATIRMGSDIIHKFSDNDLITRQARIISDSSYHLERLINLYGDFAYLQTSKKLELQVYRYNENTIEQLRKKLTRVAKLYNREITIKGLDHFKDQVFDKFRVLTLMESLILAIAKTESERTDFLINLINDDKLTISVNFKSNLELDEFDLFGFNTLPLHKKQIFSSCIELYISHAIAQAHKGSISFEKSNDDYRFDITLCSM